MELRSVMNATSGVLPLMMVPPGRMRGGEDQHMAGAGGRLCTAGSGLVWNGLPRDSAQQFARGVADVDGQGHLPESVGGAGEAGVEAAHRRLHAVQHTLLNGTSPHVAEVPFRKI